MSTTLLLRKLIYRSLNRGCKENDIILRNYAMHRLQYLTLDALIVYEKFISEDDLTIYSWTIGTLTVPVLYHDLVHDIRLYLPKIYRKYNS